MNRAVSNTQKILLLLAFLILISAMVFVLGRYFDKEPIVVVTATNAPPDPYIVHVDFESNNHLAGQPTFSRDKSISGNNSALISNTTIYSPAVIMPFPTDNKTEIEFVNIKFWLNPINDTINTHLVLSVYDRDNNQLHWDAIKIHTTDFASGNWYMFTKKFKISSDLISSDNHIKVYLWNRDQHSNNLYLDDISISLKGDFTLDSPKTKTFGFEDSENTILLSSKYAKSGFYSAIVNPNQEVLLGQMSIGEINHKSLNGISFSCNYLSEVEQINAYLLVSVKGKNGESLLSEINTISSSNYLPKSWEITNGTLIIPDEYANVDNTINFSLLNKAAVPIYIDDIYVVIKEKEPLDDDVLPAIDLTKKIVEKKPNSPPYDFVDMNIMELDNNSQKNLTKLFMPKSKIIVGKFDENLQKDQIFLSMSGKYYLLFFVDNKLEAKEVKIEEKVSNAIKLFTDENFLFILDKDSKSLIRFEYNSNIALFEKTSSIANVNFDDAENVVVNSDKSISIFSKTGEVSNYEFADKVYKLTSTKQIIKTKTKEFKTIKAKFFNDDSSHIFIIYKEGNYSKYVFVEYNAPQKLWQLSSNHINNSIQGIDQLSYENDLHIFRYDNNSALNDLLEHKRSERFELKILNFNHLMYNMLYRIEFVGFPQKQNPKYYETTKIICGDFTDDDRYELIIHQDNYYKSEWLNPKTEVYKFR